ncbi:MAG: ATP-binding cassette domain-containing protein [Burkholderiaceae bacterium]
MPARSLPTMRPTRCWPMPMSNATSPGEWHEPGSQVGRGDHPKSSPILRGIELEVGPGERVGLIGRNRAGKTTVMRTIGGLARHQQRKRCAL